MVQRAQRIRHFLLRWHRRLGAAAAVLVCWLSVSGIILNHTEFLQLAEKPIHNGVILAHYGISEPKIKSFKLADQWLNHVGGHRLFIDSNEAVECKAPLRGVVLHQQQIVALCDAELLLLTRDGELIERVTALHGLPPQTLALAEWRNSLWLATAGGTVAADIDSLSWQPAAQPVPDAAWSTPQPAPQKLQQALKQEFIGADISRERVLLDMHSGRIFGQWGVYLMDLVALVLCLLAASGLWVWGSATWRRRRRPER